MNPRACLLALVAVIVLLVGCSSEQTKKLVKKVDPCFPGKAATHVVQLDRVQIGAPDFNLSTFGNPLKIKVVLKQNGQEIPCTSDNIISGTLRRAQPEPTPTMGREFHSPSQLSDCSRGTSDHRQSRRLVRPRHPAPSASGRLLRTIILSASAKKHICTSWTRWLGKCSLITVFSGEKSLHEMSFHATKLHFLSNFLSLLIPCTDSCSSPDDSRQISEFGNSCQDGTQCQYCRT